MAFIVNDELSKKEVKEKIKDILEENPNISSFLESKGAKGKFIAQASKRLTKYYNRENINIRLEISRRQPRRIIDNLLYWGNTPQGREYWLKIHNELQRHLSKF